MRIVNGSVANEGRVELCFHGHWGSICSDTWNDVDAEVTCRQLGYIGIGKFLTLGVDQLVKSLCLTIP